LGITSGDVRQVIYGYEDESQNLVNNWDFEEDFNPDKSDWYDFKAKSSFSDDAHTGKRSVRIHNRYEHRKLFLCEMASCLDLF
jgi:hypothetical protein